MRSFKRQGIRQHLALAGCAVTVHNIAINLWNLIWAYEKRAVPATAFFVSRIFAGPRRLRLCGLRESEWLSVLDFRWGKELISYAKYSFEVPLCYFLNNSFYRTPDTGLYCGRYIVPFSVDMIKLIRVIWYLRLRPLLSKIYLNS